MRKGLSRRRLLEIAETVGLDAAAASSFCAAPVKKKTQPKGKKNKSTGCS